MYWLALVLVGCGLFSAQQVACREYFGFIVSSSSLGSYSIVAYGCFDGDSKDGFKTRLKSRVAQRFSRRHDGEASDELELDVRVKAIVGERTTGPCGAVGYQLGGGIKEYRDYFELELKGQSVQLFERPLLFTSTKDLKERQSLNLTLKSVFNGTFKKISTEWNLQKAGLGQAASSAESKSPALKARKASPATTTGSRLPSYVRRSKLVGSGRSERGGSASAGLDCIIS